MRNPSKYALSNDLSCLPSDLGIGGLGEPSSQEAGADIKFESYLLNRVCVDAFLVRLLAPELDPGRGSALLLGRSCAGICAGICAKIPGKAPSSWLRAETRLASCCPLPGGVELPRCCVPTTAAVEDVDTRLDLRSLLRGRFGSAFSRLRATEVSRERLLSLLSPASRARSISASSSSSRISIRSEYRWRRLCSSEVLGSRECELFEDGGILAAFDQQSIALGRVGVNVSGSPPMNLVERDGVCHSMAWSFYSLYKCFLKRIWGSNLKKLHHFSGPKTFSSKP